MLLPSLEDLAYAVDDERDHIGGGHCAGFGADDPDEDRRVMIDQYVTALRVLVDHAIASDDGWSLSRPILFVAHQLCENAVDAALLQKSVKVDATSSNRHSLSVRMGAAHREGVLDDLTNEQRQWCDRFIETIAPITFNGFPGRFPHARVAGRKHLDEVWCCLNLTAIRDAAITFAQLMIVAVIDAPEAAPP